MLQPTNEFPIGNNVDVVALHKVWAIPELSEAVMVGLAVAKGMPEEGETVTKDEQVRLGAVVSVTVMVKRHELTLLALSVAMQLTTVDPNR